MTTPPRGALDFANFIGVNDTTEATIWLTSEGASTDARAVIQTALDTGKHVNGNGQTYGVSGTLTPTACKLRNITLKQLAPDASQSVVTLSLVNVSNVELIDVKIDRNGDGTNSGANAVPNAALATAKGLHLQGGTGHWIENVEVYGNDSGTGIYFVDLDSSSTIIKPYVHDIFGISPGVTDDQVGGMIFSGCTGMSVHTPIVKRLGWKDAAEDDVEYIYSRGIAFTGCENLKVYSAWAEDCWQGIDCTGNINNGNIDLRFYSPVVKNCTIYGMKLANNSRRVHYIDGVAENVTRIGYISSASFDDPVGDDDANKCIRCVALNCGDGVGTNAGFANMPGSRTYPVLAHFIDCISVDDRAVPLVDYGFYNEVASRADAMARTVNCKSVGHVTSGIFGFSNANINSLLVGSLGSTFSTDTYISSSAVNLRPNDAQAGTRYYCMVFIEKTAAGGAQPVLTIRYGANGSTADTSLGTITFAPQTAAVDTAILEVWVTFRAVGSGTSATMSAVARLTHELAATGFSTDNISFHRTSNAGFNSEVAGGKVGLSINAGASAVWTVYMVHARIDYPNP